MSADLVRSDVARSRPDDSALPTAVAAVDALARGLYARVAATGGNAAFSPLSIAVALAMTANGARGETRAQMLEVLGGASLDDLDAGMNALTGHLAALPAARTPPPGKERPVLTIADALFAQEGLTWQRPFLDALAADYDAGVHTVDYRGATEDARAAINAWTSDQTGGMIPEIVPAGALTADSALTLVNALYFKAAWAGEFASPVPAAFALSADESAQVPMITGSGSAYAVGPGWQAVSMLYVGGGFAMTLVVPDSPGALGAVESGIVEHGLGPILAALAPTTVSVTMPTYSLRSALPLARDLSALGMPLAFTDHADFGAMTADVPLMIGEVLHEAVVDVDEHGTEAAAATAVVMTTTSAVAPRHHVRADHPFLFVIHDVAQRTPLFVGRVCDPRS